jgi:glycosyltransferase involved in cell wall biosynthesis
VEKYQVAIVIPAFNEEKTIFKVLQSVASYGEVIVINDASSDKTMQIADNCGVFVVNHENNKGYDAALNSGFEKAKSLGCNIVVTFDADGQHDSELIKDFVLSIESGFEIVIGVRNKRQRLAEHIFSLVSSWKWGVSDPLCGMKAYRIDLFKELGYFDSYKSIGTELTLYAASRKKNIAQFPINVKERQDQSRLGGRLSTNFVILRSLFRGYIRY